MTKEISPRSVRETAASGEEVITARVPRGYYWLAVFWMVFGFVFAACAALDVQMMRTLAGRATITVILFLFFWLPGLMAVWLILRTRVIADESGLRWRGMTGWKHATWMQVRDYYIDLRVKNNRSAVVETENGRLRLDDLTHGARLKGIVQNRARWAKAGDWEFRGKVQGTLELSAPETFIVDPHGMRTFAILLVCVVLIMPLLLIFKADTQLNAPVVVYQSIRQTWQTMGALWALGLILMVSFPGLLYSLMLFASWPLTREAHRRRGQSLTLSTDGLIWHDPLQQREVRAHWEDVRDFYRDELPGWVTSDARYVIETSHGNFDYVAMRNSERLQALVQKYCAAHGLSQEWQCKRDRTQSTPGPGGARVHTYRHPQTRALLWFVMALMLSMWFAAPMRILGWMPKAKAGDPAEWVLGAFFILLTTGSGIWILKNYFCFQILTDEKGITQRCGRHEKFIPWLEVSEYETSSGLVIVRSAKEVIRFYAMLSGQHELQKTIEARATNSATHAW